MFSPVYSPELGLTGSCGIALTGLHLAELHHGFKTSMVSLNLSELPFLKKFLFT